MNPPRETSVGFWFDAREFLVAAEHVINRATGVSLPAYFLFSRSIELSLKAYLLGCDMTAKTLSSRKFGHNLAALLAEAVDKRLHALVPFEPDESTVVQLLSLEYLNTRLGYRVSGATYLLPSIEITEEVARKLISGLANFCAPPQGDAGI